MKKITFDYLMIELTRKCNMSPVCPHCMRGNPQDITITTETIDSLLRQTVEIGKLSLTGGEPTLCLDEIDYIVSKLYEYKIPLFSFELTTNGLIYDERLVCILKRVTDLIAICRNIDFPDDVFPAFAETSLQISMDDYHSHRDKEYSNFLKYRESLKRIAQVTINTNGNFTRKCGNAEANDIRSYGPFFSTPDRLGNLQIAIIDAEHPSKCPAYPSFNLSLPEQVMICCAIELKCDGNLIRAEIGDWDYATIDDPRFQICNVLSDNIYNSILKYNKNRMPCNEWSRKMESSKLFDVLTHLKDFYIAKDLLEKTEKEKTLDCYLFNNHSV